MALHLSSPSRQLESNPGPSPVHLLLVEDNRADVLLVKDALALHQVQVQLHVAPDGEEALNFIERAEQDCNAPAPGVVLLDLNLPKRTGAEVLSRLRQSGKLKDIPVVILTSSDSPKDREETSRLGATRYFRKPTGYDEFLNIGRVLKEIIEGSPKGMK
jgi:two-component system, chemotaxis family, response regulator Rcp1